MGYPAVFIPTLRDETAKDGHPGICGGSGEMLRFFASLRMTDYLFVIPIMISSFLAQSHLVKSLRSMASLIAL
jgi:hypothetical protein